MKIRTGQPGDLDLLVAIDNDASTLFEQAGLHLDAERDRQITLAARERWRKCLAAGTVLLCEDVAFAAVGSRDSEPYLDQLSVRTQFMRKGIGTALLYASMELALQARGRAMWLTTYQHLSWNRPYYERHGFVTVSADRCGEQMREELSFERQLLPAPHNRIVMRREFGD